MAKVLLIGIIEAIPAGELGMVSIQNRKAPGKIAWSPHQYLSSRS